MLPLFEAFPQLWIRVPYISLGEFPTPYIKLESLAEELGLGELYIKQDGFSARPFGGNKVRKLEFLLGEVLRYGGRDVITFGYAGSNHALAVAIHAHRLGLKSISLLMPQPNAGYVRRNLLMALKAGAELHLYPNKAAMFAGAKKQKWLHFLKRGRKPFVIPPGGSTPAGVLGYVNAVFEWQKQLAQNKVELPDVVYVALGTAGTLVGLMIGFKVMGIPSKIVPVRVVNVDFMSQDMVVALFERSVDYLCEQATDFPRVTLDAKDLQIRDEFLGDGYALFTEAGMAAVKLLREKADIALDGTYTGKVFAALVHDARLGLLQNKRVCFWNTLNAFDVSCDVAGVDYHRLPQSLHYYFEEEVQPLDR